MTLMVFVIGIGIPAISVTDGRFRENKAGDERCVRVRDGNYLSDHLGPRNFARASIQIKKFLPGPRSKEEERVTFV